MASNKRKETSTTDFFLSVVHKEESEKKQEKNKTISDTKDKASSALGNIITLVNETFDNLIKNKISSVILSGIIAVLLFAMVSGGNIFTSTSSGTTLNDVPVSVEGLDDKYEISGVPDSVEIGLIGPSIDINSVTLTGNYEAYINVDGLDEGKHTVNVETRNFPDSLSVMIVPQTFTVTISPKVSQKFSLGYTFENEDALKSNYSVKVNDMAVNSVTVRASEDTLQKIDKVQACIDLSDVSGDFEQDATIKAFTSSGQQLDVEIAPSTVHVSCTIDTYVKTVPVQANFVGTPADGYAISNYKLSTSKVKVYGNKETIKDLENVTIDVDVTGINENKTLKNLKIKCGTSYNKLSVTSVNVSVEVDSITTRTFSDLTIQVKNLKSGYTSTVSDKATIEVTGSTSVLSNMSEEDITVYVDADGLKKGTHSVPVQIDTSNQSLTYTLTSGQKVNLVIGG